MVNSTVLMITGDSALLDSVRLELKVLGGTRIDVVGSVKAACELLDKIQPRLVIADWNRKHDGFEVMDRLLWATSKLARHTPVVVIADQYREDHAVMFYRLGVSDYISRTDHLSSLPQILSVYLQPSSSSSSSTEIPAFKSSSDLETKAKSKGDRSSKSSTNSVRASKS